MFSSLTTKLALKKVGLPSDTFDLSSWTLPPADPQQPRREPNKLRKPMPEGYDPNNPDDSWGSWFAGGIGLPLTVHPWLSPAPPPVKVAAVPSVGDLAPVDREGRLRLGGGQRTLVVFLRCVGCAFAQKTFLTLRTLANRYAGTIRCVAVSHSSAQATRKWIDLLGGAWSVEVIIDEDRSLYAAWGLGLGSVWHIFHPAAQIQGWKEKGWLGEQVAEGIQKQNARGAVKVQEKGSSFEDDDDDDDMTSAMGTKWQEAGAFAVDGKGTVIWGGKALRVDDMMNLEDGARILEL